MKICQVLFTTFRRSAALQRIAADERRLRQMIKNDPRKVIPVAAVARMLEVSVRQLWKWIDQGWLSTYARPSEHYRKGISKPAFTRFLNRVVEHQQQAAWFIRPVVRGRPAAARERLRAACRSQKLKDGMTTKECADALGISTDSVLRAFKRGYVRSYKASRCRFCLGDRERALRRKKRLTAK